MRENPIGESIYNRIKEYDIISRKVFLSNLSTEHRAFYNKYSAVIRKRNSLANADNKAKANEKAREGMKKLRELRTPDEIKENNSSAKPEVNTQNNENPTPGTQSTPTNVAVPPNSIYKVGEVYNVESKDGKKYTLKITSISTNGNEVNAIITNA